MARAKKPFSRAKLGSGGRFRACVASGKSRALCAHIGRRAHGSRRMAQLSAAGRRRGKR